MSSRSATVYGLAICVVAEADKRRSVHDLWYYSWEVIYTAKLSYKDSVDSSKDILEEVMQKNVTANLLTLLSISSLLVLTFKPINNYYATIKC